MCVCEREKERERLAFYSDCQASQKRCLATIGSSSIGGNVDDDDNDVDDAEADMQISNLKFPTKKIFPEKRFWLNWTLHGWQQLKYGFGKTALK